MAVGFDWPQIEGLFKKLAEETQELQEHIRELPPGTLNELRQKRRAHMAWSIDEILSNPDANDAFSRYLAGNHADKNLDLANAIEKYKANPSNLVAREIYDTYVKDGAAKQINLSQPRKEAIRQALLTRTTAPAPPDLFDQADKELRKLIGRDTMPRFFKTEEGKPYSHFSLNQILSLPGANRRLREYARKEFSGENLDFVSVVADYRLHPSKAAAVRVFLEYVAQDAPKQANISSGSREALDAALFQVPPGVFDGAERDVKEVMTDMIPNFVTTPEGKPYSVSAEDLGKGFAAIGKAEEGTGGDFSLQPGAPDPLPDIPPRSGGDGDIRGGGTDDDAERDDEKKDFADE